jgi:exodeoxyribonuclease VII large subunit
MQEREIYTVSQLNRLSRSLLEDAFPNIWIEGEISNCSKPSSGHLYFSLKDVSAQLRCAMFKLKNQSLNFIPKDGMHVLIQGNVSLYEPRGDYQFIVAKMEQAGDGALQRAFEQLKNKLLQEGLFALENKKAFPLFPKRIGVISSATGAAIRDVLKVLHQRFPHIEVILYPTQVQGVDAATQIVAAIELANKRQECDVLMLTRGGGSLEDLWPFNEEIVARAIFVSQLAIVTGIGHEVDFTIADFVADHRAPTPSAAAEFLSPDQNDLKRQLLMLENRLIGFMTKHLHFLMHSVIYLQKRLRNPQNYLQDLMQRFDHLEQTLRRMMQNDLHKKMERLNNCMRALNAVSPLAVLERGYSITIDENNKILKDASLLKVNDKIRTQLHIGTIESVIISTSEKLV